MNNHEQRCNAFSEAHHLAQFRSAILSGHYADIEALGYAVVAVDYFGVGFEDEAIRVLHAYGFEKAVELVEYEEYTMFGIAITDVSDWLELTNRARFFYAVRVLDRVIKLSGIGTRNATLTEQTITKLVKAIDLLASKQARA